MALFVKQDENRSELQKRLAAELQERAKQNPPLQDMPDGVNDSAYIKDTKQTTSLAWVWVLIAASIIGIVVWLIVTTAN